MVNGATSHCLIQWPNWTGVFDDRGDQRNNHGDVVSQETGLSTPAEEYPSQFSSMPLTKESLYMKDLSEALDGAVKDDGYFTTQPLSVPSTGVEASMSVASNVSTCGSNITTPVVTATRSSPKMSATPDVVGSTGSGETSPTGESLVLVDSATTAGSVLSDSSYNQVSPADIEEASETSTVAQSGSFKHKVRRSWNWLSGSGSSFGAAS
jgi:hypothetical protein